MSEDMNSIRGEGMDDLQRLYEVEAAARSLLAHIDMNPSRLTAGTFGVEAEKARRLIDDLRDALDVEFHPILTEFES